MNDIKLTWRIGLASCLAHALGQVTMWMGVLIASVWGVLFALMARHVWFYHGSGAGLMLPLEPPAIGLVIGLLGLVLGYLCREKPGGPVLAGLALNAVALGLALALRAGSIA